MASRNIDDDGEEELGAYIYQTSHTAKIFREKAAEASLSAPLLQYSELRGNLPGYWQQNLKNKIFLHCQRKQPSLQIFLSNNVLNVKEN